MGSFYSLNVDSREGPGTNWPNVGGCFGSFTVLLLCQGTYAANTAGTCSGVMGSGCTPIAIAPVPLAYPLQTPEASMALGTGGGIRAWTASVVNPGAARVYVRAREVTGVGIVTGGVGYTGGFNMQYSA